MIAIIPAAGKGTRMASITLGSAKELLSVAGRPVLARIIEEAREALVDEIVVVTARGKLDLTKVAEDLGTRVAFQEAVPGLAGAVAAAKVEDEALVLNGDCLFAGGSPSGRMADLVRRGIDGCIAVEHVADEETRLYGIVEVDEGTGGIQRILEKPGPDATASRWAIAGRYAFGPAFMAFLAGYCREATLASGQELSLTPVFDAAIAGGFDLKAVPLQPGQRRVDCGEPQGYALSSQMDWPI